MSALDAPTLARLQFAFTISFHIIFPAFTIGLASYLAVLETLWLVTGRAVFRTIFDFWKLPFAIAFGMGVVSGIVLSYQFGTNWSVFSDKTGPVLGPLMGYEVLTAFFLEAGFLGILLFGREKVGTRIHFLAVMMVATGTMLSAFWILAANSWMHTPRGFGTNDGGQFIPHNWWQIIFNPSFPYRLVHMVLAAYLTTALTVGAVAAWRLLRDNREEPARVMFSMAMWMLAVVAPIQIVAGDFHGINTLVHQPAKIAALEGHFETRPGQPLYLFGWPDTEAAVTRWAIGIPKLGSFILTHDMNGVVKGLNDWRRNEWPPAAVIFWSFRVMVGLGLLMTGLGVWGLWQRWRGRLYESTLLLRAALAMGPAGFVAILAGWITTEVGRQPYTVYGLLRTADSVSPIAAPALLASLSAFFVVYVGVFGSGAFYILRVVRRTPSSHAASDEPAGPLRAAGVTPAESVSSGRGDL